MTEEIKPTQEKLIVIAKKAHDKKRLKNKFGERCAFCGCTNKLILTIDHKMPKNRGGSEDDSNKQVLCWVCNQLKDSLTMSEFKKYMKSLYYQKDLCKVRLNLPSKIDIVFSQHHYPTTPDELKDKEEVKPKPANGSIPWEK